MLQDEEKFEKIKRSRSKNPPAILYKYTTVETARIILTTGKIRFQSPLHYNDPFDSQWDTLWPTITPEAIEYQRTLWEQALRDPSVWPTDANPRMKQLVDQERKRIELLSATKQHEEIAKLVQAVESTPRSSEASYRQLLDLRRRMRVLCLSETDRSILMWSHYADQHRGVALGFDATALESWLRRPLYPVEYTDGLPELVDMKAWVRASVFGLSTPIPEGPESRWALTKHSDWKYEKEWRFVCVAPTGTLGDCEEFFFPRASL